MSRFLLSLFGACVLFVDAAWALTCEYDPSVDESQGLDFLSAAGLVATETVAGVSEPDECRKRCCDSSECDMVQMGYPMDGPPQCVLVKCWVSGRDACALKPSTQFTVYRKTSSIRRESSEGKEQRVVPLVQTFQPKESDESNNGERGGVGKKKQKGRGGGVR